MPRFSPNEPDPPSALVAAPGAADTGTRGFFLGGAIERVGRYRWTTCALLFFATTINYIDRQVLGILAPTLRWRVA